jgi:histidinol-phosphate aminotransferase
MSSIWDIANAQLRDLAVYEPGKPIEETARELGADSNQIIKLASNENPLGPSPKALAAMRDALESAHLYPDGGGFYLREALAEKLNLTRDHTILGSGSNEIIEFLGHAFLNRGDDVITSEHAFIAYKLVAAVFGAHTIEVPSPDFRHDLDGIIAAITPKTRLIFIANPNNPTGTLATQKEIDRFVERVPPHIVIVFDEAYFEYLDNAPDTLRFVRAGRNVAVLRTFSKIQGLASLRIGYGIARPELIQVLQKTRQPFNVNGLAQAAALAGLEDHEHRRETKRVTNEGRAYLEKEFAEMNLRFVPSAANFVLVNVGDGAKVFRALLEKRIIVRALKGYNLPEWIRVSVGTMEQNRRCIAAMKELLPVRPA